jgi:ABC-type transport system substrate-binding protein
MRSGRFVPLASCMLAALGAAGLAPHSHGQDVSPVDLARPADLVTLADGKTFDVEPLAADTLLHKEFPGDVVLQVIDKASGEQLVVKAGVVYKPFERRMLEEVAKDAQKHKEMSPVARWSVIEKVLAEVLRFHLAVRDRPSAGRNEWAKLQTEIEQRLLEARRHLLRELAAAAHSALDWAAATSFADRMVLTYPADPAVLDDVARLRTRWAGWLLLHGGDKKFAAHDYATVRQQLDWVEEYCQKTPRPDVIGTVGDCLLQGGRPVMLVYQPEVMALRQFLEQKATGLLKAALATTDHKLALRHLDEAMLIWPRLPGLKDELLKRKGEYAILYVGVRQLPVYLAPPLAWTDAELQALELLFEGLLQSRPGDAGRVVHSPQLAIGLGTMHNGNRSFALARQAYWCNGKRLTQADVQRSFEMLTNAALPGSPTRAAELADAVELLPRVEEDLFRVDFHYRKGLLDPSTPFVFKVLPRDLETDPAALDKFARSPIGSGPYCYAGTVKEHGRTYVVFKANPFYHDRPGRPVPQIREVRFFISSNPVADFSHKTAPMHLLLDTPLAAIGQLQKAGIKEIRTLKPRRVYFLAVNCGDRLLADVNLRRALAHGTDRDRLLSDHFRGRKRFSPGPANFVSGASLIQAAMSVPASSDHRSLNGPFPADAWACCKDGRVPPAGQVFDPVRARKFLTDTKLAGVVLQLKYPDDDPRVAGAAKAIAAQLGQLGASAGCPITIQPVPLPPHQLRVDLLGGNYQLAYWYHDFPDDTYSLWPLLDPREDDSKKIANYLRYSGDGTLTSMLVKASSHRDFNEVKKQTHEMHDHLFKTMPLIPLWQLDVRMAVHPALTLPPVDPLRVFSNIEQWRLTKK